MLWKRLASTARVNLAHPHADGKFPPLDKMLLSSTLEAKNHSVSSTQFWKRFNIFVTFPVLVITGLYVLPHELEHIHHLQEHEREFVPIPYLRKRKSVFPWGNGDETLFAHPNANPAPKE